MFKYKKEDVRVFGKLNLILFDVMSLLFTLSIIGLGVTFIYLSVRYSTYGYHKWGI